MPPVRDGSALRRLGRRKVEEARFLLVTVHYGTVLRWTLLVLLTKLGTLSLGTRVDLWHLLPNYGTLSLHRYFTRTP